MIVAAASAFSQCTFRIKERNPIHRTLFSMACLIVTVQAAGSSITGSAAQPGIVNTLAIAKPLVGAATAYFVFNTFTVATAIALSMRQPLLKVWHENFLWSAPSYFVGALAAAGVGWMMTLAEPVGGAAARVRCAPVYLDLSRATRSTSGGSRTSGATRRRWRICTWRRSKRWRSRSTPRIRPSQLAHPPRAALRRGARARARA